MALVGMLSIHASFNHTSPDLEHSENQTNSLQNWQLMDSGMIAQKLYTHMHMQFRVIPVADLVILETIQIQTKAFVTFILNNKCSWQMLSALDS